MAESRTWSCVRSNLTGLFVSPIHRKTWSLDTNQFKTRFTTVKLYPSKKFNNLVLLGSHTMLRFVWDRWELQIRLGYSNQSLILVLPCLILNVVQTLFPIEPGFVVAELLLIWYQLCFQENFGLLFREIYYIQVAV